MSKIKIQIPDDFPFRPYNKTFGSSNTKEILGCGFMSKPVAGDDHTNYRSAYYSLCYLISGRGEYIDENGMTYELMAGMYFQRMPGRLHSTYIEESGTWVECFIDMGAGIFSFLVENGMVNPEKPCAMAGLNQQWIDDFAAARRSIQSAEGRELRLLFPRLLDLHQRIILASESANAGDPAFVQQATAVLSQNLNERIDLKQLCRENGWGYEWFRKEFRQALGISPKKYRIRARMDEARRLLMGRRDIGLEAIADLLGYSTVYEFCAQFKRYAGISPGKFRNG